MMLTIASLACRPCARLQANVCVNVGALSLGTLVFLYWRRPFCTASPGSSSGGGLAKASSRAAGCPGSTDVFLCLLMVRVSRRNRCLIDAVNMFPSTRGVVSTLPCGSLICVGFDFALGVREGREVIHVLRRSSCPEPSVGKTTASPSMGHRAHTRVPRWPQTSSTQSHTSVRTPVPHCAHRCSFGISFISGDDNGGQAGPPETCIGHWGLGSDSVFPVQHGTAHTQHVAGLTVPRNESSWRKQRKNDVSPASWGPCSPTPALSLCTPVL